MTTGPNHFYDAVPHSDEEAQDVANDTFLASLLLNSPETSGGTNELASSTGYFGRTTDNYHNKNEIQENTSTTKTTDDSVTLFSATLTPMFTSTPSPVDNFSSSNSVISTEKASSTEFLLGTPHLPPSTTLMTNRPNTTEIKTSAMIESSQETSTTETLPTTTLEPGYWPCQYFDVQGNAHQMCINGTSRCAYCAGLTISVRKFVYCYFNTFPTTTFPLDSDIKNYQPTTHSKSVAQRSSIVTMATTVSICLAAEIEKKEKKNCHLDILIILPPFYYRR